MDKNAFEEPTPDMVEHSKEAFKALQMKRGDKEGQAMKVRV